MFRRYSADIQALLEELPEIVSSDSLQDALQHLEQG
jgi:hypothetical protein